MLGLSSWTELAPDREAMRGDPWYQLCAGIAFLLVAVTLFRASTLEVDVTILGIEANGGLIAATVTPLSVHRPEGPPSSRQRREFCSVASGSCRLSFRWRKDAPLLPERHVLALRLRSGDQSLHLGDVQLVAPRWFDPVTVICKPQAGCTVA